MARRLHSYVSMEINGSLENYDLVILGGGTGSTVAAWTLAAQGQRVAVIERKYIGGSCPNIACLPSKNTPFLPLFSLAIEKWKANRASHFPTASTTGVL